MSKIELDRNNKTLYGQIADILRERIMSGEAVSSSPETSCLLSAN